MGPAPYKCARQATGHVPGDVQPVDDIHTLLVAHCGAGLFVLARFLDHFDGELARQKGMTSRLMG
ncbi:MAG: CDP-alcohol phosphatidyltransferase family protein [Rhodospirillales bacterium]|nr:CDP-alcohol phosphatidyltransferase family protein [Rhodospirillales bacterium]